MSKTNHQAYIGRGAKEHLLEVLTDLEVSRVLIVHGQQSFSKSGARDLILPYLKNLHIAYFSDFTENPILGDAEKLVRQILSFQPDLIIAVGGGSAMDIAKAARAITYLEIDYVAALKTNQVADSFPCPLLAIPTTAGTGSEATHFSVIYHQQKKYSLTSAQLLPEYAIVDPLFSLKMPPYVRACTAMDAFCQAIESYWAVQATEKSRLYAEKAILLIKENALAAMQEKGIAAKACMAEAAYYAGCAINISKTTAPHALSYWLTMRYHIPHGHAVSLNIGRFLWAHGNLDKTLLLNGHLNNTIHTDTMRRLYNLLGCKDGSEAYRWIIQFMKQMDLLTDWKALNLNAEKIIEELICEVNVERMQNNPIKFTQEQLRSLLVKVL